MFTPSAMIGMWFRGLMAVAIISGAVCLFALWYRELPRPVEEVRPLPTQRVNDFEPARVPGALERISFWRPGLDKPTALLIAALLLSMFSLGAGRLFYPLLRSPGKDEPSSSRSDRRAQLQRPDGTELNIEEFGKSDGPTVILTHGWGMDSTEWYYAKKELAKEYRVVVWDLPGVGLSTRAVNNDYSIERFATDLHAIVQWSGVPRIVLVGHSYRRHDSSNLCSPLSNSACRGWISPGSHDIYKSYSDNQKRDALFGDRKTCDRAASLSDYSSLSYCLADERPQLSKREHPSFDGKAIIFW